MELFHDVNIDWLGKKWYFLGFSLIFSVAGVLSMLFWHHIPVSVDFRGGTLVYVKFAQTPDFDKIRNAVESAGLHNPRIQTFGRPADNSVIVSLDQKETSEADLSRGRDQIVQALKSKFGGTEAGKFDLNNASKEAITGDLAGKDPLHAGSDAATRYASAAQAIADFRDKSKGGLLTSFDELSGIADAKVIDTLKQDASLGNFSVFGVEIVGPQVGSQLQGQAFRATLYSLAGMLVYLWFRFELIYGVAAVVAVFHDTLITIGAFSLLNKEISLTVIAAILTLVGYSMNDTIVVFDRIRENLKYLRRESLANVVNLSINQTLSRTVLTSGLTFLTVLSLYIFGGEVLRGFSFALVVGILIGTYSSIAIAAPMLVAYQEWRGKRGKATTLPASRKQAKVQV